MSSHVQDVLSLAKRDSFYSKKININNLLCKYFIYLKIKFPYHSRTSQAEPCRRDREVGGVAFWSHITIKLILLGLCKSQQVPTSSKSSYHLSWHWRWPWNLSHLMEIPYVLQRSCFTCYRGWSWLGQVARCNSLLQLVLHYRFSVVKRKV